jgi:hypothetical protein
LIEAVKLAAFLFGEDAVAAEGRQQTGAVAPLGGGLMMFPAASTRAAVFRFVTFS